ncbi:MAG: response regulator, partial [Blastocatellia bacterium]|nr:response regulator [Blastocatellia bacterium]
MRKAKSVLVVEDDDGIREAMQVFLEIEGYRVITAADGRQGLEALSKASKPCLILLDLMMPIMNGWEFADALKDTRHADIPVVIVSAYADQVGATKCEGVIAKPIDLDTLMETVRKWCGNSLDQN